MHLYRHFAAVSQGQEDFRDGRVHGHPVRFPESCHGGECVIGGRFNPQEGLGPSYPQERLGRPHPQEGLGPSYPQEGLGRPHPQERLGRLHPQERETQAADAQRFAGSACRKGTARTLRKCFSVRRLHFTGRLRFRRNFRLGCSSGSYS